MKKQYIEVPLPLEISKARRLWHSLIGIVLLPWYLVIAWILKTPGIIFHFKCVFLAVRLFFLGRISVRKCFRLICFPMDSTRYFEFHEVFKSLSHVPFCRYLDVSSPRILPLMLLMRNKTAIADMINPDNRDIRKTERLSDALRLTDRCRFSKSTIETAQFAPETFDLITCISVLEHIKSDREAVNVMWSLLNSGGRLVLTLPCRALPLEQYISCDCYKLSSHGSDGYNFWQRYYDEESLNEVIFNITGAPTKMVVYGEKKQGLFYRNASMKRLLGRYYPYWRESYMMAKEYRYFKTVSELPGEGVVMLEFIKQ